MTIERLQLILSSSASSTEVNVVVGDKLHPIKEVYKDDAPIGNLRCFLVILDESVEIKRPLLI